MKISKIAVLNICRYLEKKGLPVFADELFNSKVRTEFRYLLSLYSHHRNKFIFPGEKVTVYRDKIPYPSVVWNVNSEWLNNLDEYEDAGQIGEKDINNNLKFFLN
jgi:hypothetical protein